MKTPYIAPLDAEGGSEEASRLPDWREVLAIIVERLWIGLAVCLVVFLGFYAHLKRSVPYYRSTAVLLVEAQLPKLLNYQDVVALNVRNLEYFNSVINTLHSRQMLESALRQTGLADREDFLPGVQDKVAGARSLVTITPIEKSRLIHVNVEHTDSDVASALANAMAQAYIQQDLDNRMSVSMQAVEWLQARSLEYRAKLERGLMELQKYREESQSVSLEEDQNIVIAKLKALNSVLTEAQTERIAAETQWRTIRDQMDRGMPTPQLAVQLSDPGVVAALSQLREHQQQVAQLRQRYRENYPDLKEAQAVEQMLAKRLEEACNMAVHALKMRYEGLKVRESGLQGALREQEQEAFALARALVRYDQLKRDVEADQEIYQSVIARMKEAGLSGSMPTEVIRIAEAAVPALAPFRPQPRKTLVRGGVFGVVAGLGVIFLLYFSDHRFRRNEEVERVLGTAVLGTLPFIDGRTVHERGLVSHLKQQGEVGEAFRTLRAGMQVNAATRDARVLLVTSTQPGEGKSLVSTNLAITFAQDNRRTLLIGGDFRRPALGRIFDMAGDCPGLAAVLKGEVPWREALQSAHIPNLDVLTAGGTPEHPSELLGGPRLGVLLAEVREVYDRVIIDAPPVLGVSDTLVLLPHADGVLFVVRYGVTHRLGALHAARRIRQGGTPCLGALMNGVNMRSFANYRYYQRYGYAYPAHQAAPEVPAAS